MKKFFVLNIAIILSLITVQVQVQAEETIPAQNSVVETQATIPAPNKNYIKNCQKIEKLVDKEKYSKALELADTTIKSAPNIDTAYALKSRILIKTKKSDEAKNLAEKALSINPKNYVANNVVGCYYMDNNQMEDALKYFNKALEVKPNYEYALINRGYVNAQLGKYDETITDVTKAISINNSSYFAYVTRGIAYQSKGNPQKALQDFNKAISIKPKEATAYRYRAGCYADMNNTVAALSDINRVVAQEPNDLSSYLSRLYVYSKINASKDLVLKDLYTAETLAKTDETNLSKILTWNNQFNEFNNSIKIANKILEINPNNKDILPEYAYAELALGNYKETLEIYEKYGTDLGKSANYANRAVAKLGIAGRHDTALIKSAISDLDIAIQNQDINIEHLYSVRGAAYVILEDYKTALSDLNNALVTNPTDIKTLYWKGFAEYELNNYTEAYNAYKKITELDSSELPALINTLPLVEFGEIDKNLIEKAISVLEQNKVPIATISGYKIYIISPYSDALGRLASADLDEIMVESISYLNIMRAVYNDENIYSLFERFIDKEPVYAIEYIKDILSEASDENVIRIADLVINYLNNHPADKYRQADYKSIYKYLYSLLGDSAMDEDNIGSALFYYTNAIRYGLPKFEVYKHIGDAYYDNSDYFNAIKYYTQALNVKGNARVYLLRASAKQNVRDYDGAIYDYTKAVGYDKSLKEAYFERGQVYFDQKKYTAAFNDYVKYSSLDKSDPTAQYNAGVCQYNMGKKQAALPYLTRAKDLYQKQGDSYNYNKTIRLINEIKGYSRW